MLSIRAKAIASNIVTYQAVHTVTILAMPCFVHAVHDLGLAVTTERYVSTVQDFHVVHMAMLYLL